MLEISQKKPMLLMTLNSLGLHIRTFEKVRYEDLISLSATHVADR